MRVFVTGATGALGSAATRALLAEGHEVTGLARGPEKAARLAAAGVTPCLAQLFDVAALAEAMRGHDAVANLATHIPVGAAAAAPESWAEDRRIRAEGSAAVAEAAIRAGVARFVQEGVVFVYAEPEDDSELTEDSPLDPDYPPSVLTVQRNAERVAQIGGTTVVLRFGWLYGNDANTRAHLENARAGRPLALGRPDAWVTRVNVADAGRAVAAGLGAAGGVYNVGATPTRRSRLAEAYATAAGVTAVRLVPESELGPGSLAIRKSLRVSSAKFRAATGWQPRHPSIHDGWPSID